MAKVIELAAGMHKNLGVLASIETARGRSIPDWLSLDADNFQEFGVGALITFPLMYGLIGFVGGLLVAFLYNLVAQRMGGLQLDVE